MAATRFWTGQVVVVEGPAGYGFVDEILHLDEETGHVVLRNSGEADVDGNILIDGDRTVWWIRTA